MPTTENSKNQTIQLNYSDTGHVTVTPDDEDRFVLTAQNAVKACQKHFRATEAIKRFKSDFIGPLRQWCTANAARVAACYVPAPTDHLQVFVIGATPAYDFALGQEVSALERELYHAGWKLSVLQIPQSSDEELSTYFDLDGALQVHAQFQPAS